MHKVWEIILSKCIPEIHNGSSMPSDPTMLGIDLSA